jgi:hypothetical protein
VDDLLVGRQAVETIVEKTVVFLSPQVSVPFQVDYKCNTEAEERQTTGLLARNTRWPAGMASARLLDG